MYNLVYASTATHPFSNADLLELLRRAREKNETLSITGLLLYRKGRFMQALEGEEGAVRSLYAAISQDPSHHHVSTLLAVPMAERIFPHWAMGFKSADEPGTEAVPGYDPAPEFPPISTDLHWQESMALRLLAGFMRER